MQINEIGSGSEVNLAGILDFYVAWRSKLSQGGLACILSTEFLTSLKKPKESTQIKVWKQQGIWQENITSAM